MPKSRPESSKPFHPEFRQFNIEHCQIAYSVEEPSAMVSTIS